MHRTKYNAQLVHHAISIRREAAAPEENCGSDSNSMSQYTGLSTPPTVRGTHHTPYGKARPHSMLIKDIKYSAYPSNINHTHTYIQIHTCTHTTTGEFSLQSVQHACCMYSLCDVSSAWIQNVTCVLHALGLHAIYTHRQNDSLHTINASPM